MTNITTTGGPGGEPDRSAAPGAEAAAMFTPEAAARITELTGMDARQFALGLAAVMAGAAAAEAECRARLAADGQRPS